MNESVVLFLIMFCIGFIGAISLYVTEKAVNKEANQLSKPTIHDTLLVIGIVVLVLGVALWLILILFTLF